MFWLEENKKKWSSKWWISIGKKSDTSNLQWIKSLIPTSSSSSLCYYLSIYCSMLNISICAYLLLLSILLSIYLSIALCCTHLSVPTSSSSSLSNYLSLSIYSSVLYTSTCTYLSVAVQVKRFQLQKTWTAGHQNFLDLKLSEDFSFLFCRFFYELTFFSFKMLDN